MLATKPGAPQEAAGQWNNSTRSSVFLQEVFTEMEEKYGEVEEMNVCDNLGDHLVGNVYVKVFNESECVFLRESPRTNRPSRCQQVPPRDPLRFICLLLSFGARRTQKKQ